MGKEILPLNRVKQQSTSNVQRPPPTTTTQVSQPTRGKQHPVDSIVAITVAFILFIGAIGMTIYATDSLNNPSEEWCQSFNQSSSVAWQLVIVENGMCIKTETGFHANGRSIFK